jgi:hypothetical protein
MRLVLGASIFLWISYLILAATWQPQWMPDISLVRRITTYEDPLDGLTRSIYAFAHGDITGAFKLNPMFPMYIGIVVYGIYASLRMLFKTTSSVNPLPILTIVAITLILTMVIRVLADLPLRG